MIPIKTTMDVEVKAEWGEDGKFTLTMENDHFIRKTVRLYLTPSQGGRVIKLTANVEDLKRCLAKTLGEEL